MGGIAWLPYVRNAQKCASAGLKAWRIGMSGGVAQHKVNCAAKKILKYFLPPMRKTIALRGEFPRRLKISCGIKAPRKLRCWKIALFTAEFCAQLALFLRGYYKIHFGFGYLYRIVLILVDAVFLPELFFV